jgi:hypothetical protein
MGLQRSVAMTRKLIPLLLLSLAVACSAGKAADPGAGGGTSSSSGGNGNGGGGPGADAGDDANGPLPFAPDSPNVYVAKVKNVLLGLPPTDDELKAVIADPTQLGVLVDGWMKQQEYQTKMLRFFELAFQQTQITPIDFVDMLDQGQLQLQNPLLLQNVQQSFARTMLDVAMKGQPFTQAPTTQTHALTTALKTFYALLDVWQIANGMNAVTDYFQKANPSLTIYVTAKSIPLKDTLDPTNANYMHWTDPGVANMKGGAACQTDPISYPARANTLFYILQGSLPGRKLADGTQCPGGSGAGQLTAADYSDWTMTTIRAPSGAEAATPFYDLQTLRGGTQMVLERPYVGFFSTPAFFANWQTNQSNQMRVTLNQTLIVATGAQIDGSDGTTPSSTPGLDSAHASNAQCVGCHQLLDPTRSILASTFSWNYGLQIDPTWQNQKGLFAFQGVESKVTNIFDFANVLATHPLFASAWAQKLCYYVNSEACTSNDPEFQKIVDAFKASSYSWNALVKAVVTSPITTHAVSTATATTNGEVVGVSRRDHICAAWNARLGFADICGLDASQKPAAPANALAIVNGLPSDGYGRGSVAPVLPNQPSLFYRAGTENLCEAIAALVIDNKSPPAGAKTWSSAQADAAIPEFVSLVMGVPPSDPRSGALLGALQAHFASAKAQSGATATDALQSTFAAACMAPSAVSMGM